MYDPHGQDQPYFPKIRPLKGRFKNIFFDSLGETRWARFLSELNLSWTYQPQGFNLDGKRNYLCDFWISEWRCYLEAKPDGIDLEVPIAKCRTLARGTPYPVLLVVGQPGPDTYYVNVYGGQVGADRIEIERGHFVECPRCDGFCVLGEYALYELGPHQCRSTERAPLHTPTAAPRLFAAYDAARNMDPRDKQ